MSFTCFAFFFYSRFFFITALIGFQELTKLKSLRSVQFVFRKTDPKSFYEALRDLKHRGIYSFVIDTKLESLSHLFKVVRKSDELLIENIL